MEGEKKDKVIEGLKEELIKKDNALKVSQAMICDYIVEVDKAELPIKALEKKGAKRKSTKKPRTTQSGASLPKVAHKQSEATAEDNKGSLSNFAPTCYFCHIRGHKRPNVLNMLNCAKIEKACLGKR